METDRKTCAQLVESQMQERNIQLEEWNDIIGDSEANPEHLEQALEELSSLALDIENLTIIKILMSTGGPADWIEVKVDNDGGIKGMTYHYADWFDHAETKIDSNSYLWDYAEQIAETYK